MSWPSFQPLSFNTIHPIEWGCYVHGITGPTIRDGISLRVVSSVGDYLREDIRRLPVAWHRVNRAAVMHVYDSLPHFGTWRPTSCSISSVIYTVSNWRETWLSKSTSTLSVRNTYLLKRHLHPNFPEITSDFRFDCCPIQNLHIKCPSKGSWHGNIFQEFQYADGCDCGCPQYSTDSGVSIAISRFSSNRYAYYTMSTEIPIPETVSSAHQKWKLRPQPKF